MKMQLVVLAGLAISFAVPTFAQQKETVDPEVRQQIAAIGKKYNEAQNNNDAAAVAACFTEDGVFVTDKGTVYGRQAIEKWYTDDFQEWRHSNHTGKWDSSSPRFIGTAVAASRAWSATIQGKTGGPIQLEGYWSSIYSREGDEWKIRMSTYNITPAPASATASAETK